LTIHFFTIVLNGMPFIKYHIKVLKNLPFDWHWHIIEGIADLKYDTSWSLKTGGMITEKLHRNGLSNDGTTEYIDTLKKDFPNNISVYRKDLGNFWDGKVEMVNAPIPYLPDQCLLWQIDVDELWDLDGISKMVDMFKNNPNKMSAFVYCHYFVGPTKFVVSMNTWATLPEDWLRIFRFNKGMYWSKHEPPTLVDKDGIDCGRKSFISRDDTLVKGITFQHFAYVIPQQVLFKEIYYGYRDACSYWRNLQKSRGARIDVSMYLPWANNAIIENWDEKKRGKLLYPGECIE